MNIFIIAGEVSGDMQAGRLVREIKKIRPDLEVWGIGGPCMKGAGTECVRDITDLAVVGFWEVLKNYGRIRRVFFDILSEIKARKPAAVILVDYPGFNLRLAKKIKELNIPVIYYISPQVWAWGKGRVREIKELVSKMIVIFSFEKEIYEKAGVPVEYVGHPIAAVLKGRQSNKDEIKKQLGLVSGETLIGILPGSRAQEIKRHLPVFLESALKLKGICSGAGKKMKFIAAAASPAAKDLIEKIIKERNCGGDLQIPVVLDRAYDIMEVSDLVLTSSGTATVETAWFGTPMIVIYKLNWFTYFLVKSIADIKHIAMANIICGERVVPELVQNNANSKNIAEEAGKILKEPDIIRKKLSIFKQRLGETGAAQRAAKIICEAISD